MDKYIVFGPDGSFFRLDWDELLEKAPAWLAETGRMWEVRVPGVEGDISWERDENRQETLEGAVRRALPEFEAMGLTLLFTAALCLRLNLIVGTGVGTGLLAWIIGEEE